MLPSGVDDIRRLYQTHDTANRPKQTVGCPALMGASQIDSIGGHCHCRCPMFAALLLALSQPPSPINACVRELPNTSQHVHAPTSPAPVSPATNPADVGVRPRRLELSFSSAEKFYNQSVYDPTGFVTRRTIPVSTLRPTGDWLFADRRASLFVAFDLPLEPRVELRDGDLVETYVSPSVVAGLRASLLSIDVLEETKLELQLEGSLGWLLAPNEVNRLFPGAGWRFHVHDLNGFTLFAGLIFEFRLDTAALVYGVGHRF